MAELVDARDQLTLSEHQLSLLRLRTAQPVRTHAHTHTHADRGERRAKGGSSDRERVKDMARDRAWDR
eukprot:5747034-Prorocentrum_lima.AAC.1